MMKKGESFMARVWSDIQGDAELEQVAHMVAEARAWEFVATPDTSTRCMSRTTVQNADRPRLVITNQNEWTSPAPTLFLQRISEQDNTIPICYNRLDSAQGRFTIPYTTLSQLSETLHAVFELVEAGIHIEKDMSLFHQAVTSLSHDGIICVDRDGMVTVFNQKASDVLGVPIEAALGKSLISFNPTAGLQRVLQQREIELEDVISINGRKVAANRAPIIIDGEIIGAVSTFQDVTQLQQYEQTVRRRLRSDGFESKFSLSDIIATSEVSQQTVSLARQCGQVDATVVIIGESGTGKEMLAQGIHNASMRRRGPFVAVNCAALPEALLESELFGYDEGAFTGANRGGKQGLFELAHGGTIFLDEIGELPMAFQGRLLRVLQEREVLRVGGKAMIPVDVRVIAATHEPLRERVKQGLFRTDLFYRLFVLPLHVLPLRDRREDIVPLAKIFFDEFRQKYNKSNIALNEELMRGLMSYDWPGNVRELRNAMERCVVLTPEHSMVPRHLLLDVFEIQSTSSKHVDTDARDTDSDNWLLELYESTGSVTNCAVALGVHRTTVWRRLKRLGVHP